MPEISRFLGIIVFMLYDDHAPAHFHSQYGKCWISMTFAGGAIEGRFPRKARYALMRWYAIHKVELMEDWELARKHAELKKIALLSE